MNTLLILLPNGAIEQSTEVSWLWQTGASKGRCQRSPLGRIAGKIEQPPEAYKTIVLVPSERVSLLSVDIPSRNLSQVKQALPYVTAELVASEITQIHLSIPGNLPPQDQPIPVAAVQHEALIHWLDQLHSAGLAPDNIYPDSLAAPDHDGRLSVLLSEKRSIVRCGERFAQALDSNQGLTLIDAVIKQYSSLIRGIDLYDGAGQQEAANWRDQLVQAHKLDIKVLNCEHSFDGMLLHRAAQFGASDGIDLLQGGYRQSRKQRATENKHRGPLILVATFLFAMSVFLGTGWWFDQQADELQAQQRALYKQLFPEARRIVNPRRQMAGLLSEGGVTSVEGLQMIASLSQAMAASPNQLELLSLNYRSAEGRLDAELRAPDVATLGQLQQSLAGQSAANVELISAAGSGEDATGQIRLQMGDGS